MLEDVIAAPGEGPGTPFPSAVPPPPVPVPVPGTSVACPPVSTVELTWTTACRSGATARVRLTMNATPARTPAGRNRLPPAALSTARGGGTSARHDRRPGSRVVRFPGSRSGSRSAGKLRPGRGQAQWPRQTQFLAHSTMALTTATSHGRGTRRLFLARIRSSPSAPGSTSPTAADSARRRACSRSSSGAVMPSPACPQRHGVSCSKVDLRAAIPRAV
jgi:hypothetical protein